jgi:hypothetical protein
MKIRYWAIISTSIPHAARLQRENYDQKVDWGFAIKKGRWFSMAAGVLMMVPSVLSDGHETSVGVGMMFLVLGIVTLSRERKS